MRTVRALVFALTLAIGVTGAWPAAGMMAWFEFEFLFDRYDAERAVVVEALRRELPAELEAVDFSTAQIGIELYGPFLFRSEADIGMVTVMVVDPATCKGANCLIVHMEQKRGADTLSVSFTIYGTGAGGYTFSDVIILPDSPSYYWTFETTGGEVRVVREGTLGTPATVTQE